MRIIISIKYVSSCVLHKTKKNPVKKIFLPTLYIFFHIEISNPNNETEILFSESLKSVKQSRSRYYAVFIVRPTRRISTFTNISDCIIFARSLTLPSASHISQAQSSLTLWTLLWVLPAYCSGIWLYNQSQIDIQFCHRPILDVNFQHSNFPKRVKP